MDHVAITAEMHKLRFRTVNRDIWQSIKDGRKKVETRAATVRYKSIKAGDKIEFLCGKQKFAKIARKVKVYKNQRGFGSMAAWLTVPGINAIKNPETGFKL